MKSFLLKNQEKFTKCLNHQICIDGLDERLFIKWAYGISKGMEYLSTKKIMHGDLAARNILIGSKEGQEKIYVPKISDFGLSRAFYDKSSYQKQERDCIPWKWMDIYFLETGTFTMNSDLWSFGIVLWEMFSLGRLPYAGENARDTISEINSGYRLPVPVEISRVEPLAKIYREVCSQNLSR
jgi:serine/threonine protein kinase